MLLTFGSLAHQFGAVDFGLRLNDLGLGQALCLSSRGQRLLERLCELDILDENALDLFELKR